MLFMSMYTESRHDPSNCKNFVNFYRPQRSCESYVFTGVCLSTIHVGVGGGGVCLSACWDTTPPGADIPPGADPPGADTPRADTPWSRHPPPPHQSRHPPQSRHPLEQTPPKEWTLHSPGADTPQSRHPSGADTLLWEQTPPRADPPEIRPLLRTVRILLECILVFFLF